jgi:hypothetical protein
MRKLFESDHESDVAILPKSGALVYSSDPRQEYLNQETANAMYLEQPQYYNVLEYDGYRIEVNGIDNNFPQNFKNLLDKVYIGHGVKRTLINLLISGGVGIYKEIKEGTKIIRDWQLDTEISDWLDSFNFFTEYVPELATDMVYIENNYTRMVPNRGSRIGTNPKIATLKAISADKARIEAPDDYGKRNNIFVSDWLVTSLKSSDIEVIPMFDLNRPFRNSAMFVKMPTFGSTAYGRPVDIGAVSMLKVLALLPNYHSANLTEKGFKWIVSISQNYYKSICSKYGWSDMGDEFKTWKKSFQQAIDDFLTAPEGDKVQTRYITEYAVDPHNGNTFDSVKITKLDDDTKELSEVGMSLHDTYTIGYVSASSIHPQLANVNLKNQSLSGSNLREAYEMHIKTSTQTMRNLLLHPANVAMKVNFPGKNLKLGFMDLAFEDYNNIKTTKPVDAVASGNQ